MSRGIRVSEKHGVNSSMDCCIICGEPKQIILFGKLKGDAEAPRKVTLSIEPCDACKEKYLKEGVMLVEANEQRQPTGSIVVIKTEAFTRMFNVEVPNQHIAFVDHTVITMIQEANV
jgi:hypothetical protein